jgi:hypothetical protein
MLTRETDKGKATTEMIEMFYCLVGHDYYNCCALKELELED